MDWFVGGQSRLFITPSDSGTVLATPPHALSTCRMLAACHTTTGRKTAPLKPSATSISRAHARMERMMRYRQSEGVEPSARVDIHDRRDVSRPGKGGGVPLLTVASAETIQRAAGYAPTVSAD
jgi:hypothetical protein